MKVKEVLALVPDHARIGIVAKIESPGKVEMYQTVFSGHKCKYDDFKHILECDDLEVTKIHAGAWNNQPGLIIGVNRVIENEFKTEE